MIYLDSAAVVKLVVAEPESPALVDWLNAHGGLPWFTSTLAEVEVARAIRRAAPEASGRVPRVLDRDVPPGHRCPRAHRRSRLR